MNPFESSPVGFGNDLELNLADQYVSAYTPMQAEFNQSSMVGFNDAMNSGYQYTGELGTFEPILGGAAAYTAPYENQNYFGKVGKTLQNSEIIAEEGNLLTKYLQQFADIFVPGAAAGSRSTGGCPEHRGF